MARFVPVPNTNIDIWPASDPPPALPTYNNVNVMQLKPYILNPYEANPDGSQDIIYRMFITDAPVCANIPPWIRAAPGNKWLWRFNAFKPGFVFQMNGVQTYLDHGEALYTYVVSSPWFEQA